MFPNFVDGSEFVIHGLAESIDIDIFRRKPQFLLYSLRESLYFSYKNTIILVIEFAYNIQ